MANRIKYNYHVDGKLPLNAKLITRISRYGNPFKVEEHGREKCLQLFKDYLDDKVKHGFDLTPLKGKDLACICAMDVKCHGDIILSKLKELGIN
jgi:hypothetical protein